MRRITYGLRLTTAPAAMALLLAAGCDAATGNQTDPGNEVGSEATEADDMIYPQDNEVEPGEGRRERGARRNRSASDGGGNRELGELPAPSGDLTDAETQALDDAREIAERGESDPSIETVEARGAVGWIEDGEVIRIAQSGRAFYFRPGETSPFLMQRGSNVVFVTDGEIGRGMSRRGAAELEGQRLEGAQRMLERAVQARDVAGRR